MSHTLHRTGTDESLRNDFVLLAMPTKGVNNIGSKEKLVKILDICMENGAINAGDTQQGNIYSIGLDALRVRIKDGGVLNCVFDNEENVIASLKKIKELDLGMSVVVTGLFEHTKKCCNEAGLPTHTVAKSLGVWGKTELLPDAKVQSILTMCGHGLITAQLAFELVDKVKSGKMTLKDAGIELAKPCVCGAFNPVRGSQLLEKLI
ncbi:MAG: hypothetical protein K0R31_1408 [Clostridiales bacterium]|jgi:hypothetical protein|nr:hypothetical protein [Clostridiales bacterium]